MINRGVSKFRNYGNFFEGWEIAVVKKIILEYQKKSKFLTLEDFDDLILECLSHWLFARNRFDPRKGASKKTFMSRVIKNKLTDIMREKNADKRKISSQLVSLEELLETDENSPKYRDRMEKHLSSDAFDKSVSEMSLRIALSRVVKNLNPLQRRICHLLGEEGNSVKEISHLLNTPRSTIYDVIKRIRKVFMKEGLANHLR